MSARKKRSALRTIRLSKELNDILEEDAEASGITASSLINKIMKKYVEWDRLAKKFKFVTMTAETFRVIIETMDEKELNKVETFALSNIPGAITLFWFKKMSLDNLLKTISLYGNYSGQYAAEFDRKGGNQVITVHHEFGKKWSAYIGFALCQEIKGELEVFPETKITDNTVVVTFPVSSSDTRDSKVT